MLNAFTLSALGIAAALALATTGAQADTKRATLTITYKYEATTTKNVQDFDGTWLHKTEVSQSGKMTCPIFNEAVMPTSYFDNLNPDGNQASTNSQVPMQSNADMMQKYEAQMKACRSKGGTEQACAMKMVEAMQKDPNYMKGMNQQAQQSNKQTASTGKFETWFSENCTGTMTANNRVTLTKGSKVKTIETVAGTRPLWNTDANVTLETDLNKMMTKIWLVTPEANDMPYKGLDGRTSTSVAVLPDPNIIAGPTPGPIKNGSYEKAVPGGKYVVDWILVRGR